MLSLAMDHEGGRGEARKEVRSQRMRLLKVLRVFQRMHLEGLKTILLATDQEEAQVECQSGLIPAHLVIAPAGFYYTPSGHLTATDQEGCHSEVRSQTTRLLVPEGFLYLRLEVPSAMRIARVMPCSVLQLPLVLFEAL